MIGFFQAKWHTRHTGTPAHRHTRRLEKRHKKRCSSCWLPLRILFSSPPRPPSFPQHHTGTPAHQHTSTPAHRHTTSHNYFFHLHIMDNEQNSNITADGETAQKPKKRRLTPWICRNDNCGKRAQSGCRSLCIACYTEQYPDEHRGQKKINQHQCDSTQRPQNLAILGSSSTNNNANVSLQRNSNLFHRSVSIPSMAYVAFLEQRIIDMETRSEQIEKRMETRISYLEELLRDRSSSMFQSHSFSSGLDNSMNLQMG